MGVVSLIRNQVVTLVRNALVTLNRNQVVSLSGISSLYTNPQDRGMGYAKCLVHEIAQQITTNANKRCGIVSDASDPITNHMFQEIGFEEVSRYISIHTTREKV